MTSLMIKYLFVILHVATAAAWFGMGLRLASRARLVLELTPPGSAAAAAETARTVRSMGLYLGLTFVFALGAFIAGGAFATYGPVYHTSLLLIVVLLAVQFLMIAPSWKKIEGVARGESDAGAAVGAPKRLAMATGIGHLVWFVLLGLMFANRIAAVL